MTYSDYILAKLEIPSSTGFSPNPVRETLFDHQRVLVEWALRRGRAAIFADTGLGKTRMELEWADQVSRHTNAPVLILTPLAVAAQTVAEALSIGIGARIVRDADDVPPGRGIVVCNYDRLHRLDSDVFGGVVLDESSVIKHHDAKTFSQLTDAFRGTRFKLCATATPAPNDWTELGTHAEFLGVCTRSEMLSEYFVHDGGETQVWRLKGHAKGLFWRWVCSWGAMIRKPSDLGFDDGPYNLPPIHVKEHVIECSRAADGMLFAMEAQTLSERRAARRDSINDRVRACAEVVNAKPGEPWVVWCDLNAESEALTEAVNGAVEITGSDDSDIKEERLADFADGRALRLVSKPSICGWGLNWQHCARMAFVGVTDSWEAYYQAIRRCWRFGQKREVHVHIFASESEGSVVSNLKRKERDARAMADALSSETREAVMESVLGQSRSTNPYNPKHKIIIPKFL